MYFCAFASGSTCFTELLPPSLPPVVNIKLVTKTCNLFNELKNALCHLKTATYVNIYMSMKKKKGEKTKQQSNHKRVTFGLVRILKNVKQI